MCTGSSDLETEHSIATANVKDMLARLRREILQDFLREERDEGGGCFVGL